MGVGVVNGDERKREDVGTKPLESNTVAERTGLKEAAACSNTK